MAAPNSPDISAITTGFVNFSGEIFRKHVLNWDFANQGIRIMPDITQPTVMAKLSAKGSPKPYGTAEATSGNGATFSDRTLTVYPSNWDMEFYPETFRNTYFDYKKSNEMGYIDQAISQVAKEYLDKIQLGVIGTGVRNGSGTATADIADGFLTLITALVTATTLTPITTGTPTSSNAYLKFELVARAVPFWMRQQGFKILCSYAQFDNYVSSYRTAFPLLAVVGPDGSMKMNNINCTIVPCAWMGTSNRLIAVIDNNMVIGTDTSAVSMHPTPYLDFLKVRMKMPIGVQIQDTEAIFVNDAA